MDKMKYVIGLDMGIASVGWAVINLDKERIEDLGVRLFNAAERPKDGGSINENRRLARGLRKRIKRKRIRMDKIKELFVKYGLLRDNELDKLYILNAEDKDTWVLRAEGLDRLLNNREWARVLTAIAKRRGYKSNRKTERDTAEGGKLLKSIDVNRAYMLEHGYRTIGEMFAKDDKYTFNKRNKGGDYSNCINREMLEQEIEVLFEAQKNFGSSFVSDEFMKEYLQVFRWQKEFMTAKLMNKMVGKCTFEKAEPRASKNSWTFERFMLLQKVNNLSYKVNNDKVFLTKEERDKVISLAYNLKSGVKYSKIRKELKLPDNAIFTGLNYFYKLKKGEHELPSDIVIKNKTEDSLFVVLKGYHDIKNALEKHECGEMFSLYLNKPCILDKIAESLTRNKTDVSIKEDLEKIGIDDKAINALLNINFTKFGHLSYKAMNKILPFLEEGFMYDEAAKSAGYNFKADDKEPKFKLPVIPIDEIRNPVVYRSVTQARKVINAIIDKYKCSPYEIHIEVARELTKSFKDRKRIEDEQKENHARNESLKSDITEHFSISKPKAVDILKLKLYKEQQGKSAYSLLPLDYNRLFEEGYVEVDHVIPFSRSFDDSYNNKVLVLTRENQEKRNKTPYEYLGGSDRWEMFEAFVKSTYRNNLKKRERLLVKNYDSDKEREWLNRNINDTKYIARFMSDFVKKNLLFEDFGEKENRIKVKTINGATTTALRHYWGIPSKERENNDLHHAEDAVIIACATDKFQNKIREYSKEHDLYYRNENGFFVDLETGEIVAAKYTSHELNRPWPNFKEELEARMSANPRHDIEDSRFTNYNDIKEDIKPVFISRMPNRKIKGQAHEETIYSLKHNNKGIVTVKKPLNSVSKAEIEMIIQNDKCIELYRSDKDLYDRIYNRLKEFNFKADKAFSADYVFRKYSKKGEGPIVRSIKVPSVMNAGVNVQDGVAANGKMVRVDVFSKNNKNYLVPIYVADMIKDKIPNKAIKPLKPESEWIDIDESYEFRFSLYYNDLVCVKKKGEIEKLGYYLGCDRATGSIKVVFYNLKENKAVRNEERLGVQNLETLVKYDVDVLGNYNKVKKEKRKGGKKSK